VPTKIEQAELDETGKVLSTEVLLIKAKCRRPRYFKHDVIWDFMGRFHLA